MLLLWLLWMHYAFLFSQSFSHEPVTPDASPEARALLELMYDLSGH